MTKNKFFEEIHSNFEQYYQNLYVECMSSSKAKKDIVGDCYEAWKRRWIRSYPNLDVATPAEVNLIEKKYKGAFRADVYIVNTKTRELLALEEDKGHYVDKCFLKRAISNAVETIAISKAEGYSTPNFILSCPTKYEKVENIVEFSKNYLQPDIYELLKDKFKYFPLCGHGRVSRNSYLKSLENPFVLCKKLCYNQHRFYMTL